MSEAEALKDGGGVGKEDLKAFKKQLGRFKSVPDGKLFQMKDIKAVEVRHYFAPWKAAGSLDVAAGHQILLVDDLIGSGASLLSCAQFIKEQGHTVVGGLSLFSPLDRELAQTVRA